MTKSNEIQAEGHIQEIRFDFTRRGKKYGRVKVKGPLSEMWITVFEKRHVERLMTSRKGDFVKATGSGYHTGGSIRDKGRTALTARLFRVNRSEEGRAKASSPSPRQLSLI